MLLSMMISGLVALAAPTHLHADETASGATSDDSSVSLNEKEKQKVTAERLNFLDNKDMRTYDEIGKNDQYKDFGKKVIEYVNTTPLTNDEKVKLDKMREDYIVYGSYTWHALFNGTFFPDSLRTKFKAYIKGYALQPENCANNACGKDTKTEKGRLRSHRFIHIKERLSQAFFDQILKGQYPGWCDNIHGLCDKIKTYAITTALTDDEINNVKTVVSGISTASSLKLAVCNVVNQFKTQDQPGYDVIKAIKIDNETIDQICSTPTS